jgi:two-component system chemotaxis response regulator CheB
VNEKLAEDRDGAGRRVAGRDVVVLGASAGGVEAVRRLVRMLPADLPAAVFVVIHRGPEEPSLLAGVLGAGSPLSVVTAADSQRFRRGCVYVAPPDRHLLVGHDHVHVRRGPRENRARPAIDPLFRSAAANCTTRVIGVVLTGLLNDGTAGLRAIKRCGGLTVVQDPADAAYDSMPRSAIRHVEVDHVRPLDGIAGLLVELVRSPQPPLLDAVPADIRTEALIAAQELRTMADEDRFGTLAPFTCPECHGALREIREGGLVRYRCHTGHAFTAEVLDLAHAEAWERTLYDALRVQEEHAALVRMMADEARARRMGRTAEDLERRARSYEEGAELIRQLLFRSNGGETGGQPVQGAEA